MTVPVGVPAPGAVTVTAAVKVTDCPLTEGFRLLVTVAVVVAAFATLTATPAGGVLLPANSVVPAYVAVTVSGPAGRVPRVSVAVVTPAVVERAEVPMAVPLSKNVTDPVALPVAAVTVAVKVTDWPYVVLLAVAEIPVDVLTWLTDSE